MQRNITHFSANCCDLLKILSVFRLYSDWQECLQFPSFPVYLTFSCVTLSHLCCFSIEQRETPLTRTGLRGVVLHAVPYMLIHMFMFSSTRTLNHRRHIYVVYDPIPLCERSVLSTRNPDDGVFGFEAHSVALCFCAEEFGEIHECRRHLRGLEFEADHKEGSKSRLSLLHLQMWIGCDSGIAESQTNLPAQTDVLWACWICHRWCLQAFRHTGTSAQGEVTHMLRFLKDQKIIFAWCWAD